MTEKVVTASPDAVLIVGSNPLDEMTGLGCRPLGRRARDGPGRMLDTARFLDVRGRGAVGPGRSVTTLTLGWHGDTMVLVPSACTVDGKPLSDLLSTDRSEELVTRTRNGGAEVVALLRTGSAFISAFGRGGQDGCAVKEDSGAVLPVCAWVDGDRHLRVYRGRGRDRRRRRAVGRRARPTDPELAALTQAAEAVRPKQADVADM